MAESLGILTMTLDKIIVSIFGLVGILFTYWFFLMKNESVTEASDSILLLKVDTHHKQLLLKKGKQQKLIL